MITSCLLADTVIIITGSGKGLSYNVNYTCKARTDWAVYKSVLERVLLRHNQHNAQLLVIALGTDTFKNDPDASSDSGFALELQDYVEMGRMVAVAIPRDQAVLVTCEGGYDLEHVGIIVSNFFIGLCENKKTASVSVDCLSA